MIRLLYITSSSFSGSTLLTFLLAAHPRIATVGELKATARGDLDKYRCSCGAFIRSCPYWRSLGEELERRGVPFDIEDFGTHFRFKTAGALANRILGAQVRGPALEAARSLALRVLPTPSREFRRILERNRIFIETICSLRGTETFLDASKDPIRLKYMIESGLWDVKAVHLIRDGRGTTRSYMKRRMGMPEAALDWRRTNEACERVLSQLPRGSWLKLRYEDLCRDPDAALEPIFRLIGEEPPAVRGAPGSGELHILGNPMRLKYTGTIELKEGWQTELSPHDLATFDRIAGDLNRRHGYE
jgi:hypothetical protein